MPKLHGVNKLKEMEKFILEKFCLHDYEQILFEFDGMIEYWNHPTYLSRGVYIKGTIYVSNYRIFALGKIRPQDDVTTDIETEKQIEEFSLQQECYGYVFPIKNLSKFKKKSKIVSYHVEVNNRTKDIRIFSKSFKQKKDKNKFFEFLSTNVKEI